VLVNQRRQDSAGEWVEVEPTRHVVRTFKTLAENVVESLAKGDRVVASRRACGGPPDEPDLIGYVADRSPAGPVGRPR
jgi:hypothetical protein